MKRNTRLNKILLNKFVIFVFVYVALLYYAIIFECLLPFIEENPLFVKGSLITFNISFILFVWSMLTTMFTEPGKVPQYWGFFLDESDQKKKRYCLICHIFKPERCHHCSACNKCVLNMDHHCPWINNCIGFYNRKFFILMLFYIITTTFIGNISISLSLYDIFLNIEDFKPEYLFRVFSFLTLFPLMIVISLFFKFHLYLILTNTTTIENIDKKRAVTHATISYDMGYYYNWVQVFGLQMILWPFPIFVGRNGKPSGDGILWPLPPNNRESVRNKTIDSALISIDQMGKSKKELENSYNQNQKNDVSRHDKNHDKPSYQKFVEEKI